MTTEIERGSAVAEVDTHLGYCPTCGQKLPKRCTACGLGTSTKSGVLAHMADHRADPGPDGRCLDCGRETKLRMGTIGHVFDHPAVVDG